MCAPQASVLARNATAPFALRRNRPYPAITASASSPMIEAVQAIEIRRVDTLGIDYHEGPDADPREHRDMRPSEHGPKHPGVELLLADARQLALGLLARGDSKDPLEDLGADLLQARAAQNAAGVHVHVLLLPPIEL